MKVSFVLFWGCSFAAMVGFPCCDPDWGGEGEAPSNPLNSPPWGIVKHALVKAPPIAVLKHGDTDARDLKAR